MVNADSALPMRQKRTVLAQEALRKFRYKIVTSALKAYDEIHRKVERGERPLYRPYEWNREERDQAKINKALETGCIEYLRCYVGAASTKGNLFVWKQLFVVCAVDWSSLINAPRKEKFLGLVVVKRKRQTELPADLQRTSAEDKSRVMDWPMMHFGKIADFQATSPEHKIRIEKTFSNYKSVQSLLDVADSYTTLPNGEMQKILEDSLKRAGDGISTTFFNKTPANAFLGNMVPKYNFDKVTNGNMAKSKMEEFLTSNKGKELGSSLLLEVLKTKHGFQTYLNSKQSWLAKLEKILEDEAYIRGTLIKQLTMEQELCVKMKLYFLKLLGSHQFEAILKKWVSASSAAMMQPVKDFVEKDNLLLFVKGWLLSHPFSSFIHAACFKSHTKSWVTTDPILFPGQFPISTDHTEISYGDAVRSWLDSSNGPKQYGLLISGRKNSLQKKLDNLDPILEKVLGGGAAKAMKSITQKHLANSLAKEKIVQLSVTVAVPNDYWSYLGYTKLFGTFSMDYATFSGTCTAYDSTKADMQGDEFAWKGILEKNLSTQAMLKSARNASLKSSIHAVVQPTLLMSEQGQSQDAVDGAQQTRSSEPSPMASCPDVAKYVHAPKGGPHWAKKLYDKLNEPSVLNGLALAAEVSNTMSIIQKQTMVLLCLAPDKDYGPQFYRKILMSRLNEMTSFFDGSKDRAKELTEIFKDSVHQLILKILAGGDKTTAAVTKKLNAELTAAMSEFNIKTTETSEQIANDMSAHFQNMISDIIALFVNKSGTAWGKLVKSIAEWQEKNPIKAGIFRFLSVSLCSALWMCSIYFTLKTFMNWKNLTPEQKVQLIADSADIVVRGIASVPDMIENFKTSCKNGKIGFKMIKDKIKAKMRPKAVDDVEEVTVKNVENVEAVDETGVDEAMAEATSAELEDVGTMVSGWQKMFAVTESFAKVTGLIAGVAGCVVVGFQIYRDFSTNAPVAQKALDICQGITLGVATIAAAVGLFVEAACIPIIGIVCAIIGIALAIAALFVHRDPPKPKPTKIDLYVEGSGGTFVNALTAPSAKWISDYKKKHPDT
eukprot:gene615-1277_t